MLQGLCNAIKLYILHKMCYNSIDKKYRKGVHIYMKEFFKFMRHTQLLNWKIVVYSCKELSCIFKGDELKPSFSPDVISEYMEALSKGDKLKPLPMGAYEYDCCVEYLKKIRRKLFESREKFKEIVIVFDELNRYHMATPPLEDCLFKVANEVGYEVTEEKILDDRSEYTLVSIF